MRNCWKKQHNIQLICPSKVFKRTVAFKVINSNTKEHNTQWKPATEPFTPTKHHCSPVAGWKQCSPRLLQDVSSGWTRTHVSHCTPSHVCIQETYIHLCTYTVHKEHALNTFFFFSIWGQNSAQWPHLLVVFSPTFSISALKHLRAQLVSKMYHLLILKQPTKGSCYKGDECFSWHS